MSRPISDIMTSEGLVTGREGTTLDEAKEILRRHKIEKLPIVDSNFHLKGLITIKDIEKVQKYPNSAKDPSGRLLCAAALGVTKDILDRAGALADVGVDALVLDSAHGHSGNILRCVALVKEHFPEIQLVAGNVATAEGTRALIEAGADCVKVGIGAGSICTTRIISGIGMPQITAVMESVEMAEKYGVPVISDGGIKYSGDIVKALAAGARVVMIGLHAGRLRGESGGERGLSGPSVQGISRHGKPRRHGQGFGRPLFPVRFPEACAGGRGRPWCPTGDRYPTPYFK